MILPIEQVVPNHSEGQSHEKNEASEASVQTPPFWQGLLLQGPEETGGAIDKTIKDPGHYCQLSKTRLLTWYLNLCIK